MLSWKNGDSALFLEEKIGRCPHFSRDASSTDTPLHFGHLFIFITFWHSSCIIFLREAATSKQFITKVVMN